MASNTERLYVIVLYTALPEPWISYDYLPKWSGDNLLLTTIALLLAKSPGITIDTSVVSIE